MAKKFVGIDIGHKTLKLALVSGKTIIKSAVVDIPENLVREGEVTSVEVVAELIKIAMKDAGIKCRNAAVVLNSRQVYVKLLTVPVMTEQQLLFNLPFEFNDYITGELGSYTFDYMVLEQREQQIEDEEEKTETVLDIMAVAASTELIDETRIMLKKAGLKMTKAAPPVYSFIQVLRANKMEDSEDTFCFIDIGQESVRLHIFNGERYVVTRDLEVGLSAVESKIAEYYNKDTHIAHTYFITNYENCQNSEICREAYTNIAVEMMRAINFYKFSNPDCKFEGVYLTGGGAASEAFLKEIENTLNMQVYNAGDLIRGNTSDDSHTLVQAYGAAL